MIGEPVDEDFFRIFHTFCEMQSQCFFESTDIPAKCFNRKYTDQIMIMQDFENICLCCDESVVFWIRFNFRQFFQCCKELFSLFSRLHNKPPYTMKFLSSEKKGV